MLNIVVCIKQVPAISDIEIDSKSNNLVRVGAPSMMNPVDRHAVEEALVLREIWGGTVTVLSMGAATVADTLREAIAMGADTGIVVTDERLRGSDTLATAKVLVKAIERVGEVDLVLCGKRSTDGDTGQVGPAIAERLGWLQFTYIDKMVMADEKIVTIERENHKGIETIEGKLPAVCTITEKCNTPRIPSIKGKMAAKKSLLAVWRLDDLELLPCEVGIVGSRTKVTRIFPPAVRETGVMIHEANEAQSVKTLVAALLAENLI